MSGIKREIKLHKACNKLSKKESYVARLTGRRTLSYDEVLNEVTNGGFLNLSKPTLKMVLEHTLNTMIENTLKDGNSRRLGDYFMLQLEVKGRFDAPDAQFDDARNSLALKLRPLKALNRKPGLNDISVYNRNAGPKVSIKRIYSVSTPDKDTLVFGDDIVLEGENLFMVDAPADAPSAVLDDCLTIGYFAQHLRRPLVHTKPGKGFVDVSDDGRRITIPWDDIGFLIKLDPDAAPEKNPPMAVVVVLRSRGGVPTAKIHYHRARAFFDTWKKKYPNCSLDDINCTGL